MRLIYFVFILLNISNTSFGQEIMPIEPTNNKGKIYIYWGYNRGWFTDADIHFSGADYDFTLKNVVAKDRQTSFSFSEYFHPNKIAIPQYNFRIGYFFKEHYSFSIGTDHMKYVVQQNQTVSITGEINLQDSPYNDVYADEDILIKNNFLYLEHTDGLNYVNTDIRRYDTFFKFKKIKISMTEGIGIGFLIPRTNTTLLGKERYDRFHLSGFGLNALVGLHVSFWDLVFLQSELKGGYINLPNVRTTADSIDKANQRFLFSQANFLVGFRFNIKP